MGIEQPRAWQSGLAERDGPSGADRALYLPEQGLYGVFDGVGRTGAPAAQTAAAYLGEYGDSVRTARDMAVLLARASSLILERETTRGSETTATAVKIIPEHATLRAVWASVGDSRLYHVTEQGKSIEQISTDEGTGKYITNALGVIESVGQPGTRINQRGELQLHMGDALVLTTDGITGDYGHDIMDDSELLSHLRGGLLKRLRKPQASANRLVAEARKEDDRTAIVITTRTRL